ncbi:hypothetical protein HPB50_017176 [Hyalomma asiaticum]|uniref:Uncharacterized protein n=1 Tax=Hyalomma asiaticum TaxID=266040 RepID=A0ACB7TQJ9_HYAAI|nr:hypothetical protein HPB50_017176 [Hyalomma asiaticum]
MAAGSAAAPLSNPGVHSQLMCALGVFGGASRCLFRVTSRHRDARRGVTSRRRRKGSTIIVHPMEQRCTKKRARLLRSVRASSRPDRPIHSRKGSIVSRQSPMPPPGYR